MKPNSSVNDLQSAVVNAHNYLAANGVIDHPAFAPIKQAFENTGMLGGGSGLGKGTPADQAGIVMNPWTTDAQVFMAANKKALQSNANNNPR
jgi:hypothetical protein